MKKQITILAIVFAFVTYAKAQTPSVTAADAQKVVQEYFKQLNAMKLSQSADAVVALLASDFILVNGDGQVKNLEQFKKELDGKIENAALITNYAFFSKIENVVKAIVEGSIANVTVTSVVKYNGGDGIKSHTEINNFVLKKGGSLKIACIQVALTISKEEAAAVTAAQKEALGQAIAIGEAQLQKENEKLSSINEFQIGRTQEEKDEQLRDQHKVIQDLQNQINEWKGELSKMQ
ncbi:MAG: hypothetical protein NT126_05750 [Bacteroidetes bacterium]|nr:hypothetical protein [Bacteroidota bacterium]